MMTRCAAIAGMFGAATVSATPQAMAAETPASVSSTVGTARAIGRLGTLTDLVIQRLQVSDEVAASKFGTDSPIEDPVREQQVLDQVRAQAIAVGLAPDAAVAFFRDQITASKIVQSGLFALWTANPEQAPTTRPDLTRIREQLDRLTTNLLAELKSTQHLRAEPIPCAVNLVLANASGTALQRLDDLHRQALRTATHSVCRSSRT
ncbi:chorismate mutase [Nonomuraea maritima]|nr:chorismate mutase [Nonomuraea maritima]